MTEKYNYLQDEDGFKYLVELPEGFVPATLDDFHIQGRKKIGMFYLVKGFLVNHYFPRTVDERLTAEKLQPFIKAGQVFVKKT